MDISIRTIDETNIDRYGFFCYKSKPKSTGYRQKRAWLANCLPEGVRLKIIYEGDRSAGFIEYAPGEYTWRAVDAPGYMVIHCMWVVGSGKNKGYGSRLLDQVMDEAERQGMYGVATLCSQSTWLAKKGFFVQRGFEPVDQAPPSFELLVRRFGCMLKPCFPQDWEKRIKQIPQGLVIYHAGQCPYNDMFIASLLRAAEGMDIQAQSVEFKDSREARVFSISIWGIRGGLQWTIVILSTDGWENFKSIDQGFP